MFLTLAEAAAELCVDVETASVWLVERNLLRRVAGRDLVVPQQLAEAVGAAGAADVRPRTTGPINSWRGVATVIGVSEDTVGRHRKEHRDVTPCHFLDEDEVRDWWRAMHAPPPKTPRPRRGRPCAATDDGPLDVKALVSELTRR